MKKDYEHSSDQLILEHLSRPDESYLMLFDTMQAGFCIIEMLYDESGRAVDYRFIKVNTVFEQQTGLSDIIGKTGTELTRGTEAYWVQDYDRVARTGKPIRFEDYHNSTNRWYQASASRFGNADSHKVAILFNDITDRKNLEMSLAESEEKYRYLFENTDEGYCIIQMLYDKAGLAYNWRYVEINPAFEKHSGLPRSAGKTILELAPNIERKWIDIYEKVAATGQSIRFEESSEALGRVFDLYAFRIGSPHEKKVAVLFTDITKRKQTEKATDENQAWLKDQHQAFQDKITGQINEASELQKRLHQLEESKQREIFKVSLQALEEERQRMAESLHNGLGQVLYGIKISLSALSQQQSEAEFWKAKNYTSQLLTDAIKESRRISHDLMPTTLEEFGLKSAVHDICDQLHGSVRFSCNIDVKGKRLEKYLELAVYRTVQELLTNVVKHAKAANASVDISADNNNINIRVHDDGIGLKANKKDKSGIGLASIRSKIGLLSGDVKIQASPGKGTLIEINIPLPERTE